MKLEAALVTVARTVPEVLLPWYKVSVTSAVADDPSFIVKFPPPKLRGPLTTCRYQLLVWLVSICVCAELWPV